MGRSTAKCRKDIATTGSVIRTTKIIVLETNFFSADTIYNKNIKGGIRATLS